MIDWTPTYLAMMRPVAYRPAEYLHWQGAAGLCWACTTCYAIEMRAIIQGYPARQLSPRYNGWTDGVHDTGGTSVFGALRPAQTQGVCLEALMPMPPYIGVDTTTQAYGNATWAAVQTPPSPDAIADALNQKITDWGFLSYNGLADLKVKCQAEIAAGHILCVLTRAHVTVAWGCDDRGLIVLDSRGQSKLGANNQLPQQGHMDWSEIFGIAGVVRSVRYANAVMGLPPTPLPWSVIVTPPPPPPPLPSTGNSKMLDDIIRIAQIGKAKNDKVTAAERDALIANSIALVPDAVAGPPPLPGVPLVNADFKVPPTKTYIYNPTGPGVGWTFSVNSGVRGQNTAFGGPNSPSGTQTAFVQAMGTMTQAVNLTAGNYQLTGSAAARNTGGQTVSVLVDGVQIGAIMPGAGAFAPFSFPFTIAADGPHAIGFAGTVTADRTTYIDAVTIQ